MSENNYEYDDLEMQQNEEEERELPEKTRRLKSGLRFARVLILLIMVVTAIVLLFINKDKISVDNFKRLAAKIDLGVSTSSNDTNSVIDFDYNSSGKVKTYKDGIARVTDDNLVIMDNIGTQFQSVLTGFNDPQILTGSRYVCVFDRGSRRLIVADSFSVLFDHTFDDDIVTVSMNDNGYLAVVTESEAYKNHCIVFDSSFKEVYKINSLTRYIVAADISPDNKRVVLSSLYTKDAAITPQINCYKLTSEQPLWEMSFTDTVAVDVRIKSDGSVVALFEWGVCVLNGDGTEKYRYELGSDILQHYAFGDGRYNMLVISASQSGTSTVIVFDNNGKQISATQLDHQVLSADLMSDRMAILSPTDIYLYDVDGRQISENQCIKDATSVQFSDKNSVVTVSASHAVYYIMN